MPESTMGAESIRILLLIDSRVTLFLVRYYPQPGWGFSLELTAEFADCSAQDYQMVTSQVEPL